MVISYLENWTGVLTEEKVKMILQHAWLEYQDEPVVKCKKQGHDNTTFLIGEKYVARFPNKKRYSEIIPLVRNTINKIRPFISIKIPEVIFIGSPSDLFPFDWMISSWIEGESLNLTIDTIDKKILAYDLGLLLKEFQCISFDFDLLAPGYHNYYRDDSFEVYKEEALQTLCFFSYLKNKDIITEILNRAAVSLWNKKPIFVHGDIALGNMLYKNNKLNALIDFGTFAMGDPACDLMMTWNFFEGESRAIFKNRVNYDFDTWVRGMAWTLWKSIIELAHCQHLQINTSENLYKTIDDIILDYTNEK